jgi:phosphatidylserine/phosphatidylglycerophosphate/cardiolipin synthase-like enzyme
LPFLLSSSGSGKLYGQFLMQHDIMKELHKQNTDEYLEDKEEQRQCLCSNSTGSRCSSLHLSEEEKNALVDEKLKELAQILIELYMRQKGVWIEKPKTQ